MSRELETRYVIAPSVEELSSLLKDTGQWDDFLTDELFEQIITNGLVYECVIGDDVIGYVIFSNFQPHISVEESLYIKPEFQCKWITKDRLQKVRDLMTHIAFDKLKVQRLVGMVPEDNTRSRRLTQSVGFKEEGTFRNIRMVDGKLINIVAYAMLREER